MLRRFTLTKEEQVNKNMWSIHMLHLDVCLWVMCLLEVHHAAQRDPDSMLHMKDSVIPTKAKRKRSATLRSAATQPGPTGQSKSPEEIHRSRWNRDLHARISDIYVIYMIDIGYWRISTGADLALWSWRRAEAKLPDSAEATVLINKTTLVQTYRNVDWVVDAW